MSTDYSTSIYFPTPLPSRQGYTFFDPANPGVAFSVPNNPVTAKRKPQNVRKYTMTTNGTSVINGDREYPPAEISLTWNQIDYTYFEQLAQWQLINPIVMVDHLDNGYLGVLIIESAEPISGLTRNVWAVTANFLVIAPYNGLISVLNSLAAPTISFALSSTPGYIAPSTTINLWTTVFSPWGESVPSTLTTITNSTTNAAYNCSFIPPASVFYRKTRIYWNTTSTLSNATFFMDILSGFPTDIPNTFTLYGNYAPYCTLNPPSYGTSFQGTWNGGLFITSNT